MRWWRRRGDDDFGREIRSHLAIECDHLMAEGVSREKALAAARRQFGNITSAEERYYDSQRTRWFDDLVRDTHLALRSAGRNPRFCLTVILTLGLGIGANTAIFSVVNPVLLRPLPYPNPDALVRLVENIPAEQSPTGTPRRVAGTMDLYELSELAAHAETLSHVAGFLSTSMTLTGRGPAERLSGAQASPATFSMLGVSPLLGRAFEPSDGAEQVVMLSAGLWQQRFGNSRDVLGQTLVLDGADYRAIGVMPEGFQFPDRYAEFWVPFELIAPDFGRVTRVGMLARVKDGTSIAAAAAETSAILHAVRFMDEDTQSPPRFELLRAQEESVAPVRPALMVLVVAVAFILLIACVNVANLVLGRTATRRHEIAVRAALGAGRGRLIRQLGAESLVLALAGGAAGLLLAAGGVQLLRVLGSTLARRDLGSGDGFPLLEGITLDTPVLLFTLLLSIATGLAFALALALRFRRWTSGATLRGTADAPVSNAGKSWIRAATVVAQTALALLLLIGGGLLIRSFAALATVDPGYDSANVLTFQIALPPARYSPDQVRAFGASLAEQMRGLPGVQAVGYAADMPMLQQRRRVPPFRNSPEMSALGPMGSGVLASMVSPDYFDMMGIEVRAGRGFDAADRAGSQQVILINEALAREQFPRVDPVGRTVYTLGTDPWLIVGIVEDAHQRSLEAEAEPQVFFSLTQMPARGVSNVETDTPRYYFVRTASDPRSVVPAVQTIVERMDNEATLDNVASLDEIMADSIATPRMYAVLMGVFAAVAVLLAAVGVYGLLAYTVVQRTREIGIRMALGARRVEVLGLVLRESAELTGIGILLGLGGALGLTRYLEGMLFGLTPLDPVTFGAVSLLFALVASAATLVPARRATKVDPMVALRCE